jgi:amino-acid N-acetyltransferase
MMKIRDAKVTDAKAIHELITCYAEQDKMLFRSLPDIYENLRSFKVAENEKAETIGCCVLQVVWADLAEIKSLAVREDYFGQGIGRQLVEGCIATARELGLKRLFSLTLTPKFFEKTGFRIIDRQTLPMKVWSDCARCSKQDHCDETAMEMVL